jgi:4-hydroxybenzoate polyprenyltransferase
LDGTLLRSDLLMETGLAYVGSAPLKFMTPLAWLTKGKASLKEGLALATEIDVSVLPYDPEVLELIHTARGRGQPVVLATASHHTLAQRVANHLQVFDSVLATSEGRNLSAQRKRDALVALYGERGFDYAGNAHDDVVVWGAARQAYVVNPHRGVERRAAAQGNVAHVVRSNRAGLKDWVKALRLHQWMKNFLVFVPALAAHQLGHLGAIATGMLAFLLFGLCASSVYILNDLLDLTDDRHHKTKHKRPFASGRLSIQSGLIVFPLLLVLSFAGAWLLLPPLFSAVLFVYYALTLAYSLLLKRLMALDVIALASLYTMRILAGGAAFTLPLTFWLLAFSMFIFLSLALVKRYAELRDARQKGSLGKARGRGYYPDDLEMISSLGASTGYLAVMVLALYVHDSETVALYAHPHYVWLACPLLLYWVTRIWMLTHRGEMHSDPVVFAMRDRNSLVVCGLLALVFWAAS